LGQPAAALLPPSELARARGVAIEAATSAGGLLLRRIDSIREVRHKGAVDLVTDVDVQSEREISEMLLAAFPSHTILGEEGGARAQAGSDPRFRWIVDPLDGTTNYAHGFPFFCVSIGLEVEGELTLGVVYAPCLDELFVAERGRGGTLNGRPIQVSDTDGLQEALLATGFPYERNLLARALRSFDALCFKSQAVRRAGSAALDLCYVACGRLDGYWEHQVKPWDLAAGALLVTEAGGTISRVDASSFSVDGGEVLASNGALHTHLVSALAGA
jgi:myo-inositol-1(or 4)-monophosphatase